MDDLIGQRLLRFFGLADRPKIESDTGSQKENSVEVQPAGPVEPHQQRVSDETTVERYSPNPFLELPEHEQAAPEETPHAEEPSREELSREEPLEEESASEAKHAEDDDQVVREEVDQPEHPEVVDARELEREEEPEREEEEPAAVLEEEEDADEETEEWKGLRPTREERYELKSKMMVATEEGPDEPPPEAAQLAEDADARQLAEEATQAEQRLDEVTEKTVAYFEEVEEPEKKRDVEEAREAGPDQDEERDEEDRPGGAWVLEENQTEESEQARGLRQHLALGEESRCHGVTVDGTRCLRKPVDGKAYCLEHAAGATVDPETEPAKPKHEAPEEMPLLRGNFGSKIIV